MAGLPSGITRRFWDAHSRGWDDIRADPRVQDHVLEVVDYLASVLRPAGAVVDVGCGPGHHAVALAMRGFEVTAVDYSPGMLARARAKARDQSLSISFEHGDLGNELSLASESFHGALCVGVLQMMSDPVAALGRVRRLLRPGGHLVAEMSLPGPLVPTPASPRRVADAVLNRLKHVAARVPGMLRRYEPDELARLFEAAGLEPLETRHDTATYTVLGRR